MKRTFLSLRNRTAWRELLHPLPIAARHSQWLKRDTVEMNEAVLRKPYYKIKSTHTMLPGTTVVASSSLSTNSNNDNDAATAFGHPVTGGHASRMTTTTTAANAMLPERLAALREQMNLSASGKSGPQFFNKNGDNSNSSGGSGGGDSTGRFAFSEEYGARLRPRYPQSWDTVPPNQPSRTN